ncbi:hypothetical protein EXIGLDRAFT_847253 [Exidia glandulosa HHB12029]|uniref:F-box domain-containing protein n=1 Tax=Exidia glandulosa HHB12029 TaxID=1314781 RepID=A0A166N2X8_EXIGL|nr:hypothetical protein EXIGLDRAFT_847253 [Exidia glandulosa HHB12029]
MMDRLPYDVVYRISEELTSYTPDERRELIPFNHPSLLHAPAQKAHFDLRACALVCASWSIPASTVNVRNLYLRRATPETLASALSRDDRHLLVQSLQFGNEFCSDSHMPGQDSTDRKRCTNGVSMTTLLAALSMCQNVRNLAVYEWLELSTPIDYSTYTPGFSSITTFSLGYSLDPARTLDLRSFCMFLRLLPALKRLAFGDLRGTAKSISDIAPPDFALESLAVSDDRGIDFQSYEWLLARSARSLRTFWAYGVYGELVNESINRSLRMVAPSLRTLYYHAGCLADLDNGVFGSCTLLEELCIRDLTITSTSTIHTLPSLRKLILAATRIGIERREDGTELETLHFFYDYELHGLVDMLIRPREETFPKLEVLAIETDDVAPMRDPPYRELKALRAACEARSIEFQFSRMKEVEDYYADVRPVDS